MSFSLACFCGPASASAGPERPSVVGGQSTTTEQRSWTVAIARKPSLGGDGFERQFCGGTLVAPTVVISAAHCFYNEVTDEFKPASRFVAIAGRTQLSSNAGEEIPFAGYDGLRDSGGGLLYDPATLEFDAVVIELADPAGSAPVKIAGADEEAAWAAGRDAIVTGWGTTAEGGDASDVLREATVSMIADSTCAAPSVYGGEFSAETMVCAGVMTGGRDTCQGDSGGPLVVPVTGGAFRLVGDTSFGEGCARPGFPGVYGRVADDPMRSLIRAQAMAVAGEDVVGSGGSTPTRPAPPAPQQHQQEPATIPEAPWPAELVAPPETGIVSGPGHRVGKRRVRFEFASSVPGAVFECRLDAAAFASCTSPARIRHLEPGRHSFRVRSSTQSLADPTPAVARFRIDLERNR